MVRGLKDESTYLVEKKDKRLKLDLKHESNLLNYPLTSTILNIWEMEKMEKQLEVMNKSIIVEEAKLNSRLQLFLRPNY